MVFGFVLGHLPTFCSALTSKGVGLVGSDLDKGASEDGAEALAVSFQNGERGHGVCKILGKAGECKAFGSHLK